MKRIFVGDLSPDFEIAKSEMAVEYWKRLQEHIRDIAYERFGDDWRQHVGPIFPPGIGDVAPENQYCPPDLAREIAAKTVSVTTEEGGEWQDFGKARFRKIHAIRFADGRVWDAINGWRS